MRDFSPEKGMKKGGILCVFPLFQSAFLVEKIRCSAANDLFRGSLAFSLRQKGAASNNAAAQLFINIHIYFYILHYSTTLKNCKAFQQKDILPEEP